MHNRILDVLNDREGFLAEYLKDNLPAFFYKRAFKQKINQVGYMKENELLPEYKDEMEKYWEPYEKIDALWHNAYFASSGIWDVRYIPENIFYQKIEPTLNQMKMRYAYEDKNMYNQLFPELLTPPTIARNINGTFFTEQYDEMEAHIALSFVQVVASEEKIVVKPAIDSGAGENVQILDFRGEDPAQIEEKISALFRAYGNNFIVQTYLYQHESLHQVYPHSLNTVRVISLRLNGEISILSRVLRMGDEGSTIDNGEEGCLTLGLNEEGSSHDFAMNHWTYEKYEAHPFTQVSFNNVVLPNIKELDAAVKKAHKKLYYFKLVSWDFAIDRSGNPVFIEINLKNQDINYHQRVNGPLFGDLTDKVLAKVYHTQ